MASFLIALLGGYFIYVVGFTMSAIFFAYGPFPLPSIPQPQVPHPLMSLLAGFVLVSGVAAVAGYLRGSFLTRWAFLAIFMYVLGSAFSAIEAAFFTTFGGTEFLLALGAFPSLLCTAVLAALRKPVEAPEPFLKKVREYFKSRPRKSWIWRLLLAWVSFPAFYFLFGSAVAPIVVPYYESLSFLALPPMEVLIPLQLVKGLIALAVVLPFFFGEKGSKIRMALSLTWALYTLTGLSGLLMADFFPEAIRWAHGVEIFMDSVGYGIATTFLLAYPKKSRKRSKRK
jgi:MFS family permease